jgi:ABC-type antimicrobial peptide transport system permease subunit
MAFFRHLGKKKAKFAFTLLIRSAENLETTSWKNGQAVYLQAKRGSKSVQTKVALLEDHVLRYALPIHTPYTSWPLVTYCCICMMVLNVHSWNEALSFICTMVYQIHKPCRYSVLSSHHYPVSLN